MCYIGSGQSAKLFLLLPVKTCRQETVKNNVYVCVCLWSSTSLPLALFCINLSSSQRYLFFWKRLACGERKFLSTVKRTQIKRRARAHNSDAARANIFVWRTFTEPQRRKVFRQSGFGSFRASLHHRIGREINTLLCWHAVLFARARIQLKLTRIASARPQPCHMCVTNASVNANKETGA